MAAFPTGEYTTWAECQTLLPQANAHLDGNPSDDLATIRLLIRVVRYLVLTSQYLRAEPLVTRLYKAATQQLPRSDPVSINAVCLSVRWHLALEKRADVETQIRPTVIAAEASLGSRSPRTLQAKYWLAYALHEQGKGAEALQLLRSLLATAESQPSTQVDDRVLQVIVPRIMQLISRLLVLSGNTRDALSMADTALERMTKLLPPGHPEILDANQERASKLAFLNQLPSAMKLARETLELCKRYLGTEHEISCMAAHTYAHFCISSQNPAEGDEELVWAIPAMQRIVGSEHRKAGLLENARLNLLRELKIDVKTSHYFQQILLGLQRDPGISVEDGLMLVSELSQQSLLAGLKAKALEQAWVSVAGWEHLRETGVIPASRDQQIVPCILALAIAFSEVNRLSEAEEQYWNAVNTARKAAGRYSPLALTTAVSLARFLSTKVVRWSDAGRLLQRTLSEYQSHVEAGHPDTYSCMWLLAKMEIRGKKFSLAIAHLEEVHAHFAKTKPPYHADILECRRDLQEAKTEQTKQEVDQKRPQVWDSVDMEAMSLHTSASMGSSIIPSVSIADLGARTSQGRRVAYVPPPSTRSLCPQCRKVSLASLLRSRLIPGMSPQGTIVGPIPVVPMPGIVPLQFVFDNPAKSSRDCSMCRLILGQLAGSNQRVSLTLYSMTKNPEREFFETVYATSDLTKGFQTILSPLALEPDGVASRHMPGPELTDPVSDKIVHMIQHWLQYCDECHTTCFEGLSQPEIDPTPVLPTRVIAVPAGESPRLVITNGLRGRYAALSHCWGGHSHIMCTKDTVGRFQGGIPLNELSKTVQDAIYLAQKLGIPYLWVDSLCIVQDDKQDWLEEAPRMGSVYEHASLTFAATAAVNGDVGLFAPLQSEDIVRVPCDPDRPLLGSMYLAPSTITFEEVNASPLSRRGWVLQERLLSRRTLHFAATQVYWECQETYQTGKMTMPNSLLDGSNRGQKLRGSLVKFKYPSGGQAVATAGGKEEDAVHRGTNRSYGRDYNLQETWRAVVSFYSTCSLTYLSDKLPALEGVVTKLKARTSLEYHLGHWFGGTIDSAITLLWSPSTTPGTPPAQRRAASWSWASLDGRIEFLLDGVDAGRIIEYPHDLQITQLTPPSLHCFGVVRRIRRCPAGPHPLENTSLVMGPYPRTAYYHLGAACHSDHDWYPRPVAFDDPTAQGGHEAYQTKWLLEFFAKRYPQRAQELSLPPSHGLTRLGLQERTGEPLVPDEAPGTGWVTFDVAFGEGEEAPEEVELIYVVTRQFMGRKRVATPQYLALACTRLGDDGGGVSGKGPRYKRVGVAQVHEKGWFESERAVEFSLE